MREDLDDSAKKRTFKAHKASRRQLLPLPAHPVPALLLLGVILQPGGVRAPPACHLHKPLEAFPVTLRALQSSCFPCGSCHGGGWEGFLPFIQVLHNVGLFVFSPSLKFVPQEGILILETAVLVQGEGSN